MTPIRRNYLYLIRPTNGRLRLRVTWHGNHFETALGYVIDKSKWDGRRCRINTSHGSQKTPAATINRAIEMLEGKLERLFCEFEMLDVMPTAIQMREAISPMQRKEEQIWVHWLDFVREGESLRQWSDNTIRSVRQIEMLLRKFDPEMRLSDISEAWMNRFVAWQQRHRVSESTKYASGQPGYANNVIIKNCRVLRWFVKWAIRKNLLTSDVLEYMSPKIKSVDRPVVFLTWEELMRLYHHPFETGSEEDNARDLFCFMCFTSLRYSDAVALRRTQVKQDSIVVTTQKTSTNLIIDLNKYSRAILDKHDGSKLKNGAALPYVTNVRLNKLLKRLGMICGIDDPFSITQYYGAKRVTRTLPKHDFLTSHCGRRTFICNALALGIAPHIVMKWTGHTEYEAMKPYIDIADRIRKDNMGLFDKI